tara:strand:+ start:1092 stop:1685 length:594 start_codon:yes stop_codon:yes gene_type:complete
MARHLKANKVLFLGDKDSSLISWLKKNGESVLNTTEEITKEYILSNQIDLIVSYGYHHILRKDILDLLPNKSINLHISFLPWNRGADPNFWSFVDQTPKGVSIHFLDEGIDTGDIIAQKELKFDLNDETLASTYEKLHKSIKELFIENWHDIKNETCLRIKQVGPGSVHKLQDKKSISYLLKEGWNTPVKVLSKNIL